MFVPCPSASILYLERFGALQEQLACSTPAKQTIVALQTLSAATWMSSRMAWSKVALLQQQPGL
jgi:hypothetical protein